MADIELSIVIPVYNEEEILVRTHQEVSHALTGKNYEIVWVDDGSSDASAKILEDIQSRDPLSRVVLFRRNFGQTAAMSAGFHHSRGTVIVPIDADLQNDPKDIPALVRRLDEGFDVVSGWRKNRQDNSVRRLPSWIANRLIARFTGVSIHDYGCTLKAYRAEVLKDVHLYGEMHRFIPALAHAQGGRVTEMVVNHRPRTTGVSKYGLSRTFRVIMDILTVLFMSRFITKPLHFFGLAGVLSFVGAAILGVYILFEKYQQGVYVHRNPLFVLMCILLVAGLQLLMSGLLGEVIVRGYFESQNRPIYRVRRTLGL